MCLQAKAKKSDSRGNTPNSNDESSSVSSSNRPRANSYSGENAAHLPDVSNYNGTSDTRHSADVFSPMESDSLKLNLDQVLM